MTAEFLRKHAAALAEAAGDTERRSKEAPDDFFLTIAAKNQRDAARDAARDLALAEAEEAGELVELRFIGPRATGSIPLDWFVKAVDPLSKAWKLAAYRLRYGSEAPRIIGSEISSALNLRLAGIAYGSTRILVTGNAMADMTGQSLLQATLVQTFRLLNSAPDDFYDAVDAVGGKAAKQFGELMKALDDGGYAAEFAWESGRGAERWAGSSDQIARIRFLIESIKEPEQYEESIGGYVSAITDTGRLELRTDEGKIPVRFPLRLTQEVTRLTITSYARIRVSTSKYWDGLQKRDVFKRQLLAVESSGGVGTPSNDLA